MPRFEVFVPAAPPALPVEATLRLEAETWLAALHAGLERIGGPRVASRILCDVQADGSIHVTDPRGGAVFRIRELAAAPAPAGASSSAPPARIGRAPVPRTAEDVLAELFERVADLDPRADPEGALGFLLDLAMEEIDCEAGSAFLARAGGRALELAVARGPRSRELMELRLALPMGVGIVGFCARENVCVAVSDAEKDPRFHRAVSLAVGYETRSLLCAPIAEPGGVLGALEVVNKRGGRPFEEGDLAALSYLAQRAAGPVSRAGA